MKRFAAIVILAVLASPVAAQDVQKGYEAYERDDYATALHEWKPLAEQGDAETQSNLGVMYLNGRGVPQDYAEALKWFRKAAEQGYAAGQSNLGTMYYNGQGVPADAAEAAKWFRKAADQGDATALNNLGTMYYLGVGVPHDFVQAHKWYNLAASRFTASEKVENDEAVRLRDDVAKHMTAAQIAEAQKLAREWLAAFEKQKKN